MPWILLLAVVTLVGAASGIAFHTVIVREWLIALYGTTKLVTRKALQLGHVLTRRTPTGEVLSVSGSDGDQFGALMEVTTRAISQLAAYLVVAGIVLTTSVRMGLLVLLSAPLLVLLGAPLLRPMQRWQGVERGRNSELTSMATDIVGGLRILRGIGGEQTFGGNYATQSQRVRESGVAAGRWLAAVESVGVLLSGSFVVALMWLGTREVAQGQLTVGELVSFLGYGLFLIQPMRTFVEFAQKWTRSVVSARKAVAVLSQRPPWVHPHDPAATAVTRRHRRPRVGRDVRARSPDHGRLGRARRLRRARRPSGPLPAQRGGRPRQRRDPRGAQGPGGPPRAIGPRPRSRGAGPPRRRAGPPGLGCHRRRGRPRQRRARRGALRHPRQRHLATDLRRHVSRGRRPAGPPHPEQAERALHTAAAEDVFDALPGGWQGELEERGRGLSGGQRQRLVLMRALAADPEVLVLVEPTSAVDAHTEARIAERLGAHRRGRTTVVMTASPLLLHHADEVILLERGRATPADGTVTCSPARRHTARSSCAAPGTPPARRTRHGGGAMSRTDSALEGAPIRCRMPPTTSSPLLTPDIAAESSRTWDAVTAGARGARRAAPGDGRAPARAHVRAAPTPPAA